MKETEKEIPKGVKSPKDIELEIMAKIESRKNYYKPKEKTKPTEKNPEATEKKVPPKHEQTNAQQKDEVTIIRKQTPTFSSRNRPEPKSKTSEKGDLIVAKALAEQLGTSAEIKAEMRIDELKLAVLDYPTMIACGHFSRRYVHDGIGYYGHIVNWILRGTQGVGGRTRKDILQAMSNISGGSVMKTAQKPNILARNTWNKNWRKKAEDKGEVVEEE